MDFDVEPLGLDGIGKHRGKADAENAMCTSTPFAQGSSPALVLVCAFGGIAATVSRCREPSPRPTALLGCLVVC